MNRSAAMLQLFLLAASGAGCTTGVARPLEILDSGLLSAAGSGQAGSSGPRGGAGGTGGAPVIAGRAGAGGRSELQAGSAGPGDRQDPFCEQAMDPGAEMELTDALLAAIENKSFCPDSRGPSLSRLTSSYEWRCIARAWARGQATPERGGRSPGPPVPPGWTLMDDGQTYFWVRRQSEVAEAKDVLLHGDERRPDRREDLCAAAQLAAAQLPPTPYKYFGVGGFRDAWVIFISPNSNPRD